jgi:hypothetical protein
MKLWKASGELLAIASIFLPAPPSNTPAVNAIPWDRPSGYEQLELDLSTLHILQLNIYLYCLM